MKFFFYNNQIIIFSRRSQHIFRTFEYIRTHRNVFLLFILGIRTKFPKIFMVEKIPHCTPNGISPSSKISRRSIVHISILWSFQVQFVAIMVHAFQLLFIDCNYPRAFVWWIGLHAVMFFFLFNEFYKSTYKYNSLNFGVSQYIFPNMIYCLSNVILIYFAKMQRFRAGKKLHDIGDEYIRKNNMDQNGIITSQSRVSGFHNCSNHQHNNNKKNIEINESNYSNDDFTTNLLHRKKHCNWSYISTQPF